MAMYSRGIRFWSVCGFALIGSIALGATPSVARAQTGNAPRQLRSMPLLLFPLLAEPAILEELKLTEAQQEALEAKLEKAIRRGAANEIVLIIPKGGTRGLLEREKEILALLEPPQKKRLEEIMLQRQGLMTLQEDAIAERLSLTNAQLLQVDRTLAGYQKEVAGILQAAAKANPPMEDPDGKPTPPKPETLAALKAARVKANKNLEAILNAEQKKRWAGMIGAPFPSKKP